MSNFKKVISMLILVFGFLVFAVSAQAASNILIYDISASYVAADKFNIIWTTNGSYDCTVIYSTKDGNLDDDSLVPTRDPDDIIYGSIFAYTNSGTVYYYKMDNSMGLSNQGDSNKGYYKIICYDQSLPLSDRYNNRAISSVYSIDLIKISNVEIKNITTNSAIVEWTSNSPDISSILYGTENSPNGISYVAKDTNIMTSHRLYVQNLATNTKYYFQIQSNSLTSNTIESAVYNFTTSNATYSIGLNPSGMNGTIVSSPAGINCSVVIGTTGYVSGTCVANFSAGTVVTLTASPASGNIFSSWNTWYNSNNGGCTGSSSTCTLTMNEDYVLGAIFDSAQPSVSDSNKYPGIAIEPSKQVYQSNEDLVVTLRRLDGQTAPYLINLWAKKNVSVGAATKYQLQINAPVGSSFVTTNDIDKMTVFKEGGNGDYSLITCSISGCSMETSNSVSIKIQGFPEIFQPEITDSSINQITTNANLLINDKMSEILAELNQLRSIVQEQQTQIKYLSSLLKDVQGISADSQAVLNNFITYGVDANTVKLGAGERAAVINSYKAAFDKLPQTEAELADVIKIANGRWPSITNKDAENQAKAQFLKIYKRAADMNGANDNAAVTIMAYGLRQKAENRNLNSEVNGIKIFKAIYGHTPKTTEEWNAMQAITYSGASR